MGVGGGYLQLHDRVVSCIQLQEFRLISSDYGRTPTPCSRVARMTKRFVFAVPHQRGAVTGTGKSNAKGTRICAWLSMYNSSVASNPLTPTHSYQENLRAVAVPARGGFTAVSIQDYSRVASERDEFLNFLLLPNPEGVPALEYAGLRVA